MSSRTSGSRWTRARPSRAAGHASPVRPSGSIPPPTDGPATFPADAADGRILGQSRDITLGNLRVPAAQYDARKKTLKVLNSVDVSITFEGGSHSFSDQLGSPWEQPQRRLAESLLNGEIVRRDPPFVIERCGEEMMVITNPSTVAAANQLAVARRAAGLRTNVFQTGGAPGQIGTTPTEIQTFIRGRLTAADCIHPSYVTIMGDDELVPTFPGIGGIESDLEYSLRDNADELPDVAVGRIIGNDAAAITTAVTKIIAYENSPPDGAWLRRASIAAEFQDDELPDSTEDRTFITFAETIRTGILTRRAASGFRSTGSTPPTPTRAWTRRDSTTGPTCRRRSESRRSPGTRPRPTYRRRGTRAASCSRTAVTAEPPIGTRRSSTAPTWTRS